MFEYIKLFTLKHLDSLDKADSVSHTLLSYSHTTIFNIEILEVKEKIFLKLSWEYIFKQK